MRLKPAKRFVFLALLILLAAWQSRRLAAQRQSGMPQAYTGYSSDVPPALTFVMAGLGGFRGIVSEILWFRVSRLQEECRYLELVQLAEWLTMLEPRAAEAWVYNAWNLAYNISVMMVRDEDRLRWVNNGIALLRDQGLRFNPREARLYRELAWLYQNKIGDTLDDAHLTYKRHLAALMAPLTRVDGTVAPTPENRARLASLRLDADRMIALEKRFGPLDWRLAESHAVYWASQGLAFATGTEELLCRRGVYQPLIVSVLNGRLTGSIAEGTWKTSCNPAVALTAADFLEETCDKFPSRNMSTVLIRYLSVATQTFAKEGEGALARQLYERLLAALPPQTEKPSFDDVIRAPEPPR